MPDLDPSARPVAPLGWRERVELIARAPQWSPSRAIGAAASAVALALLAWFVLRSPEGPPTESLLPLAGSASESPGTTATTTPAFVVVHAAGAVVQPGVYRLAAGARVTDLIDAAGGATADADLDQLNLAAAVSDGERVYVPRVGETVAPMPSSAGDGRDAIVNLNTATLEQLDALPGIGPATAQAIIDERDRRGGFRSVDELLDVRGIGPAKLEQLRELVTV